MSKSITSVVFDDEVISENFNATDSSNNVTSSYNKQELKVSSSDKQTQDGNANDSKERNKSLLNVTWDESAIDNEMMNKKKSKKCCIYHKKREFGESSSSSEDELSSEECNESYNNKSK
ncbi:hypothetical protein FG379_000929 [Cryptosporidium bovis]|uniref:uncharacterized protein n=1 Tax=Cryptosporidium bovis TaxID=310047 RepID=UPI003519D901|nr:hypothetical protein FG379_000929 [Cryptosporidium bovis]